MKLMFRRFKATYQGEEWIDGYRHMHDKPIEVLVIDWRDEYSAIVIKSDKTIVSLNISQLKFVEWVD